MYQIEKTKYCSIVAVIVIKLAQGVTKHENTLQQKQKDAFQISTATCSQILIHVHICVQFAKDRITCTSILLAGEFRAQQ